MSGPTWSSAVQSTYLPSAVLAWGEPYPSPLWEGRGGPEWSGLAFVCRDYACLAPVAERDSLLEELAGSGSGR